ncbi:aspartyl/asparaginyl beta-hydroxylase domain-containing protein [Streptomyces pinistramenti]|uniref:aspartyl/asparaginyl beta-hydroxylase domain-containing protein n=1 Tax=Streptomyces pinistramenti TaxID=2884812 RepID=UPI001D092360|nr:aspartyl/asparaginyl beta-hydroxylase domain-containing protein [Streptomyces pinistramenti]MCB5909705.1 aspartyl/asparaginyl beta-hydroxylase domain-containing protein [Streptomyces pinistramenti]
MRDTAHDLGRLLLGHHGRYRDGTLQDLVTDLLRDRQGRRGWIVDTVNSSLLVRQKLAYALRLEPRRLRTKLAFPLRAAAVTAPPRPLSLLCPTRNRVDNLNTFLRSVQRTAAAPGRIEVLCYVDDDDPSLPEYRALFDRARTHYGAIGRCALHVGPPIGVAAAWNHLAEHADGDFLLMANDDQLYVDYGWDVALDQRADDLTRLHEDAVLCLYFDAAQYPEGGCDFPIVSRPWYDTLGYFVPTIFQQWEVEKWVFDLAQRLGRLYPVPGVFVEHRHYQDYKAPFDDTYQRHRMTREKSFADHALFLRTEGRRVAEVDKLAARTVRERRGGRRGTTLPEPAADTARRHYRALIDGLHADGQARAAQDCAELAVRQGLWTSALHRPAEFHRELPLRTDYDPADFWFTFPLTAQHEAIVREVRAALEGQRLRPEGGQEAGTDRVELYREGTWTASATELSVTRDILDKIPEALLFPGAAVELVLQHPPARRPASCGPSNAFLRVEFGLIVAAGSGIRVGEQPRTWPEGGCLIFDDGLERERWHEGTGPGAVLTFRVPHPDR